MLNFKLKLYPFFLSVLVLFMASCGAEEQTKQEALNESIPQFMKETSPLTTSNNAILIDSLNLDLMLAQGSELYKMKDYATAINQFMAVYKFDDKNLDAIITLGNVYYDTQQHKLAIEYYQKGLELDPNQLSVRCDMATSYSNLGMLEKAIEINKETIKMDYNHVQSHHNLGVFYNQLGMQKEAEEEKKIYNDLLTELQK